MGCVFLRWVGREEGKQSIQLRGRPSGSFELAEAPYWFLLPSPPSWVSRSNVLTLYDLAEKLKPLFLLLGRFLNPTFLEKYLNHLKQGIWSKNNTKNIRNTRILLFNQDSPIYKIDKKRTNLNRRF